MRCEVSFDELLDETLAASRFAQTGTLPRSYVAPQVLGFFDFSAPGRQPFAAPRTWRPAPAPQPRRVPRLLTRSQHDALNELIALGAPLVRDFTDAELRTAFRDLARQFHPDRHPGCSGAEKTRLAGLFVRAHASYRVLKTATAVAA
jgi:hypothetical protein